MAVRKDNTTGLEYTRSLNDEEQKQHAAASIDRIYSISTYMFALGMLAVGSLFAISFINKSPTSALVCEATVFICLIALLVLVIRAKRRLGEQRIKNERYPYSSVDKKEIDKIFDLIADEEKKRERLNLFASNTSSSGSAAAPSRARQEEKERRKEPEPVREEEEKEPKTVKDSTFDAAEKQQEEEEMVSVLDDELNDVEIRMMAMAAEEDEETTSSAETANKTADEESDSEEPRRKKRPREPEDRPEGRDPSRQRPGGKRPPQGTKGKKRPPNGEDMRDPRAPQGAKKRRPPAPGYDPYYGAVYYDEYGRPIRRPPPYDPYYGGEYFYDEYGRPVRRREAPYPKERVVYDEYGRPIKRRPPAGYDPRREEGAKRKRPPAAPGAEGARRRPDAAVPGAPAKQSKAAPQVDHSKRTAAPVAMPSIKKDLDEEYVPVFINYDEDNDTAAHDAEHGVRLRANQGKRGSSVPAAPPKPIIDESDYSPADMEALPIIVDDDYNPDYADEESVGAPAPVSHAKPAQARNAGTPANVPDYYYQGDDVSPEEMDAGVIVVHDFDDIDEEEYDARYSRSYGSPVAGGNAAPAKKTPAYAVDEESYSYEEEGVVVLPRDENYEEYLQKLKEEEEKKRIEEEKKRAEERRIARKKSGKVALTIRKVRRKKIKRMSRKYKRFRASVVPLIKYLHSYDND